MKKLLTIPFVLFSLEATTLNELFDGLKNSPQTKINNLTQKTIKENKESINYSLFPKVTMIGSVEHFNRDMALVSITPTESAKLSQSNSSVPFGQNIMRFGLSLSMPIYVREIYKNKQKINYLLKASKYKSKIDLLSREALLINLVSNYNYLLSFKKALIIQQNSISTTIKAISAGVKSGAIPEFNLLRLKDSLNQIKISVTNIDKNLADIKAKIYSITNVVLDNSIKIKVLDYQKDDFITLKPIQQTINADIEDIEVQNSSFYPRLYLKTSVTRNWTKAYNTDDMVGENQASIGLYFEWDIFNKQNRKTQLSKINFNKDRLFLNKTRQDLISKVISYEEKIGYLNTQLKDIKNSIALKRRLLKSAKVAFENGSMNVDDYLKYEDNLASSKANLAKIIFEKNSVIANLAFIYGNDITKIFKEK